MTQVTAALIAAAVSAVGAITSAIISWLNKRAISAQTPVNPPKSGNPTLS
jgi:hypothetical protein